MDRKAASVLFLVLTIFAPVRLSGQEVFLPLLVEGPRISRTAFTNWESIELTYTVRWADGYEPIRTELKPQAMSFGILELDPEFAEESDIRNERRSDKDKENYFDITYHLRYMGDEKGEMDIPGQKFAYRELLPNGSEAQHFTTQGFKLAYGTVLTSDAEEIKEEFDLGSYQTKAMLWKVSAGIIILIGIVGGLALVFFRPVPAPLAQSQTDAATPVAVAGRKIDPAAMVLELEQNVIWLRTRILNRDLEKAKSALGAVCNGLKDVIRFYVPAIGPSVDTSEMAPLILAVPHQWERERFSRAHEALESMEDALFKYPEGFEGYLPVLWTKVETLSLLVKDLRPWPMYWRRLSYRLRRKIRIPKIRIPTGFLGRLNWRRRP